MRKPTSKKTNLSRYLIALALITALAGGLFAGAYYEARQERTCVCAVFVKAGPIT